MGLHSNACDTHKRIRRRASTASLTVLIALAGCGGGGGRSRDTIWVYQTPDFYQADLQRVAVVPFGNNTQASGAAQRISDKVSAILTNNGTYEVYTRSHLQDLLTEKDAVAAGIIDADKAMEIGRVKAVQALICGVCNRYEAVAHTETRELAIPQFKVNKDGIPVPTGVKKVPYQYHRNEATIECQVVVLNAATGHQIAAVNAPSHKVAEGRNPESTPEQLLREAEDEVVSKIIDAIAVRRKQVRLEDDVLRTAADFYDQQYDWEDKFTRRNEWIWLAVRLPVAADRNDFRLTIVPKDQRETLFEESFKWDKSLGRRNFKIATQRLIEDHGYGEFEAKLYSGPQPIAWYEFEIEAPQED